MKNFALNQISIYYEPLEISQRYFSISLREIKHLFNLSKVKLNPISEVSSLVLPAYSSYLRVLMIHDKIKTKYNHLLLDGIGVEQNRIALITYQPVFYETMYLLAHELGHILGMSHCNSEKCLMGVYSEDSKTQYSWRVLAREKELTKSLFCSDCKKFLYS